MGSGALALAQEVKLRKRDTLYHTATWWVQGFIFALAKIKDPDGA